MCLHHQDHLPYENLQALGAWGNTQVGNATEQPSLGEEQW